MAIRTSPRRTQLLTLRDFTGGLNLVADTFRLRENESPDVLNVDLDRRGGFQVRRGVAPFSTSTLSGNPDALWRYRTSGTSYTLAQIGTSVVQGTGTTWTSVGTYGSSTQDVCPVTFNNLNYWSRGNADVVRWNGSTATVMGSAFNNTTTASSGNVPRAEHLAVHGGYMWAANTYESGTNYPNRVRFSWANTFDNSGENWRTADYIDIDEGKDSDSITAIVPFGDHLVVFKRDSVYAIYGYSAESFSVVNISNTVGAVSHAAALATPAGLFFFDYQTGLNVYDGKRTTWKFEQIWPAMIDGSIPKSEITKVDLGWVENRLWVSVPWSSITTAPRGYTFVYDPFLSGGRGAWTKFDLKAGPYCQGHRADSYLAYLWGTNMVFRLDVTSQYFDNFGGASTQVPIDAWYRTRWLDLEQPAIKKRWRRAEAVLQVDVNYELPVVSYSNYDPTVVMKNFKFVADRGSSSAVAVWDDPNVKWDEAEWARSGQFGMVDRGANLGVTRAVSLKVGGEVKTIPAPGVAQAPVFWGVDALILKYVPRRVR